MEGAGQRGGMGNAERPPSPGAAPPSVFRGSAQFQRGPAAQRQSPQPTYAIPSDTPRGLPAELTPLQRNRASTAKHGAAALMQGAASPSPARHRSRELRPGPQGLRRMPSAEQEFWSKQYLPSICQPGTPGHPSQGVYMTLPPAGCKERRNTQIHEYLTV